MIILLVIKNLIHGHNNNNDNDNDNDNIYIYIYVVIHNFYKFYFSVTLPPKASVTPDDFNKWAYLGSINND